MVQQRVLFQPVPIAGPRAGAQGESRGAMAGGKGHHLQACTHRWMQRGMLPQDSQGTHTHSQIVSPAAALHPTVCVHAPWHVHDNTVL